MTTQTTTPGAELQSLDNLLKHKIEELRKSEERYHKMIDEVEDYAILLMDRNGIIQNWNRGAEKIKGYKEEDREKRSKGKEGKKAGCSVSMPID